MQNRKAVVLEILSKISDVEFQKNVWVDGQGDFVTSYSEAVNQLDDYTFFEFIDNREIPFTNEGDEIKTKLFIEKPVNYDEPIDFKTALNDSHWLEIVNLAEEVKLILMELNF